MESLVSDRALVEKARRVVSPDIADLDDLIARANAGDKEAAKILSHAGMLLGREIANLANIFDPKLIIISGEGVRMGEIFFSSVRTAFHDCVLASLAEDIEIRVNSWGDDIWALGAASLVIAEIFRSPIQKEERTTNNT